MRRIGVGEIIPGVEASVDAAGNLRGVRAADDPAASVKQNHNHDFRMSLIRVGSEPPAAAAHAFIVSRARLSQILFAIRVVAALGRAVNHRGQHAFA